MPGRQYWDPGDDSSLTKACTYPLILRPVLLRAHSPGPMAYAPSDRGEVLFTDVGVKVFLEVRNL